MEAFGPPVDYAETESIGVRKLHPLLNHFVITTVDFLNRFSSVCEEKLYGITQNIERLEVSMTILEIKLNSIPRLEGIVAEGGVPPPPSTASTNGAGGAPPPPPPPGSSGAAAAPPPPPPGTGGAAPPPPPPPSSAPPQQAPESAAPVAAPAPSDGPTVAKDPRYSKYFQMLRIGVHPMQIKQRMMLDGVDPDILDDPDRSAATGAAPVLSITPATSAPEPESAVQSDNDRLSDDSFSDEGEGPALKSPGAFPAPPSIATMMPPPPKQTSQDDDDDLSEDDFGEDAVLPTPTSFAPPPAARAPNDDEIDFSDDGSDIDFD